LMLVRSAISSTNEICEMSHGEIIAGLWFVENRIVCDFFFLMILMIHWISSDSDDPDDPLNIIRWQHWWILENQTDENCDTDPDDSTSEEAAFFQRKTLSKISLTLKILPSTIQLPLWYVPHIDEDIQSKSEFVFLVDTKWHLIQSAALSFCKIPKKIAFLTPPMKQKIFYHDSDFWIKDRYRWRGREVISKEITGW
jgi:hypothetical protein